MLKTLKQSFETDDENTKTIPSFETDDENIKTIPKQMLKTLKQSRNRC